MSRRPRGIAVLSLTSILPGVGWSTPRPVHFTPGKDLVPIVKEAGWDPGAVWTGTDNFSPTGFRSPCHPARSKSLYQLSYPVRHVSN
jgi:hypothetical protein